MFNHRSFFRAYSGLAWPMDFNNEYRDTNKQIWRAATANTASQRIDSPSIITYSIEV